MNQPELTSEESADMPVLSPVGLVGFTTPDSPVSSDSRTTTSFEEGQGEEPSSTESVKPNLPEAGEGQDVLPTSSRGNAPVDCITIDSDNDEVSNPDAGGSINREEDSAGKRIYACKFCPKVVTEMRAICNHYRSHPECIAYFICRICSTSSRKSSDDEPFKTEEDVLNHLSTNHTDVSGVAKKKSVGRRYKFPVEPVIAGRPTEGLRRSERTSLTSKGKSGEVEAHSSRVNVEDSQPETPPLNVQEDKGHREEIGAQRKKKGPSELVSFENSILKAVRPTCAWLYEENNRLTRENTEVKNQSQMKDKRHHEEKIKWASKVDKLNKLVAAVDSMQNSVNASKIVEASISKDREKTKCRFDRLIGRNAYLEQTIAGLTAENGELKGTVKELIAKMRQNELEKIEKAEQDQKTERENQLKGKQSLENLEAVAKRHKLSTDDDTST